MCSNRASQRSTVLPSTPIRDPRADRFSNWPADTAAWSIRRLRSFRLAMEAMSETSRSASDRAYARNQLRRRDGTARERASGKPPEMTRSARSPVGPVSARLGKSAAKARSRKSGGPAPAISAWENGKSSIVSTRPRKRIRRDRAPEQVDRARDQEAAGTRVFIHRLLERQDEARRALDLVDHRGRLGAHEADRIISGKPPELVVIQSNEWAAVGRRRCGGRASSCRTGAAPRSPRCEYLPAPRKPGAPHGAPQTPHGVSSDPASGVVQFGIWSRPIRNVTPSDSECTPGSDGSPSPAIDSFNDHSELAQRGHSKEERRSLTRSSARISP